MSAIRNSAKAIIIRDGHLLAVRNIDETGAWYLLPGGGQEAGETLVEALRRECVEEIDAIVTVGELKLIREYIGKNHEFARDDAEMHQVELMFECTVDPGYTPHNGAAIDANQTGVEWLPIADLDTYRLYPRVLKSILGAWPQGAGTIYLGDVN